MKDLWKGIATVGIWGAVAAILIMVPMGSDRVLVLFVVAVLTFLIWES